MLYIYVSHIKDIYVSIIVGMPFYVCFSMYECMYIYTYIYCVSLCHSQQARCTT